MRFVEETGGSWTAEQLRAAEAEIEQQKREWEANRLAAIKKEEEDEKRAAEEDEMLTYSREDAQNQVNNNKFSKRNPVNRRLLKVKQSERRGIVKNKRVKGRIRTARQPIRGVAQNSLGPRRALRNNSTPISQLAQSNSPGKKAATNAAGSKRLSSLRASTRLNKRPKKDEDVIVSSDDEPLVEPNKNNGVANNHSKLLKSDNETARIEQSEGSDARPSDDFDDSECSLDVMVDSTDPQESDDDTASDNDDESTANHSDGGDNGSIMSFDESEADATKENSLMHSTLKNNLESNHQIDINSPRSTRSHGRIKINLWTLDESQNLPELCAKRSHHKATGSKNSSLVVSAGNADDNETCENGNGSSAEDVNDDEDDDDDGDNSVTEDNDNNSSTKPANTPDAKHLKQSKINDCFGKTRGTSTPPPTNDQSEHFRTRKSLPSGKTVKMEKSANRGSIGSNTKNHISHFDMNRTPKVVLNKHDCEMQQQKSRLKSKT